METFQTAKDAKCPIAFEIENIYVSRRTVASLLMKVDEVTNVRLKRRFGSSDDIRVEFKFLNRDYIVWEPYGDSSRYWIGPKNLEESAGDINKIENVFKKYHPPFHRALIGNILSLRLFRQKK